MQVRAAYSVWDERTVLPGNLNAATKAAGPKPANERRVIGDGPHVLTRSALSHWARWIVSTGYARQAVKRNVGDDVAAALTQLEDNVLQLGARSEWFPLDGKHHLSMKSGLPQRLMFGLVMDARVLPTLLRMLNLHCAKEGKLEKALRAMERVETLNRPAASVAAAPPVPIDKRAEGEDMSAMRERVQKALEERKIDLREPVPEATKRQIADVLGIHSATVNRYVVDLRQAAGITVAAMPAGETLMDRLRDQLKARKIDLEHDVPMTTQEALAITLNTSRSTVNSYLTRLRAETRKAAEKPVPAEFPDEQPTVTIQPVEALLQQCDAWVENLRCDLQTGHRGPHKCAGQIFGVPVFSLAEAPSDHELRAKIGLMRSQLASLATERDNLKHELSTWKEIAAENDRVRVRWMDQALDLRRELEALKAQMNGAMVRHGEPTSTPVATVPQAITNAEVREIAGYEALGADIGRLVTAKQEQYGDSFGRSGEILRVLYPDGIRPEQMDDALAVVRITDKLFRIAAGNQGGENAYADIAGYGLLGAAKRVSN